MDNAGHASADEPTQNHRRMPLQERKIMSKNAKLIALVTFTFAAAAAQANGPAGYDPLAFVPKAETPRAMVKFNQLRATARETDFATAAAAEDSGSFWLARHGWRTEAPRQLAGEQVPVAAKK